MKYHMITEASTIPGEGQAEVDALFLPNGMVTIGRLAHERGTTLARDGAKRFAEAILAFIADEAKCPTNSPD